MACVNRWAGASLASRRGAVDLATFRGFRRAQPPATLFQPSGLGRGLGRGRRVTIFRRGGQSEYMDDDFADAIFEPEALEASQGVMQALLEIHLYKSSQPGDEAVGKNVEALVATGALSPETVGFLATHQTRFFGVPSRVAPDLAVLEVVLGKRTIPLRFVGFADGHGEWAAAAGKA